MKNNFKLSFISKLSIPKHCLNKGIDILCKKKNQKLHLMCSSRAEVEYITLGIFTAACSYFSSSDITLLFFFADFFNLNLICFVGHSQISHPFLYILHIFTHKYN